MEVTRQGTTETVEVDRADLGSLGGVGFLGSTPNGEVETQTNPGGRRHTSSETSSDGGATNQRISSPLDTSGADSTTATARKQSPGVDRIGAGSPMQSSSRTQTEPSVDRYCGSCAEFKYVRTDSGIRPYCGYHDELMDDMDACDEWQAR